MAKEFVAKCYGMVAAAHPSIHPVTLQARTKIFTKFELALKIAISKHQAVRAEESIHGRSHPDACAACNRPMVLPKDSKNRTDPSSSSSPLRRPLQPLEDRRAVPAEAHVFPGAGLRTGSKERLPSGQGSFSPVPPGQRARSRGGGGDGGDTRSRGSSGLEEPLGIGSRHWAMATTQPRSAMHDPLVFLPPRSGGGGGGGPGSGFVAIDQLQQYQHQQHQQTSGGEGPYVMRGGFRMPKRTGEGSGVGAGPFIAGTGAKQQHRQSPEGVGFGSNTARPRTAPASPGMRPRAGGK